ncbi:MAG: TraR/DksA family transcriptional regulator, partial [Nitrospiraceae bacterium]
MTEKVKKQAMTEIKSVPKEKSSASKSDDDFKDTALPKPIAENAEQAARREVLHRMLMAKRQEILGQIKDNLGQSVTDDAQRRLESAKDVGDQAMMDLERELGISLLEMQNRKRQLIDEALTRLAEGGYGVCAECGAEISERRLEA